MSLSELLARGGITLQESPRRQYELALQRQELTLLMGDNFSSYDKIRMSLIHQQGHLAERGGVIDKILLLLIKHNLIHYNKGTGTFKFASKKAKSYVDGMWLEEYTYWALRSLGVKPIDIRFSQKIWSRTKNSKLKENEIDVIFRQGDTVHFISNKCAKSLISRQSNAGRNFDIRMKKAIHELVQHRHRLQAHCPVECAVIVSSDLIDELEGARIRHKAVMDTATRQKVDLIGLDYLVWNDFRKALIQSFPSLQG